jgi:hypothetical protein
MKNIIGLMAGIFLYSGIATAGNEAGGAGIAEKNIVYAYLNLSTYMRICLSVPLCGLTPDEQNILSKIQASLSQELPADKAIVFKSEKESPGFFIIEGKERVAKTGFQVGVPIFVNLDLLYLKDIRDEGKPLSLSGAVALLVHELGHHQGEKDHLKLDILGSKMQALVQAQTVTFRGRGYFENIRMDIIDTEIANSVSQVVVNDSFSSHDLTEKLKTFAASQCSQGPVKYAALWNPHWLSRYSHFHYPGIPINSSGELPTFSIDANLDFQCAETRDSEPPQNTAEELKPITLKALIRTILVRIDLKYKADKAGIEVVSKNFRAPTPEY